MRSLVSRVARNEYVQTVFFAVLITFLAKLIIFGHVFNLRLIITEPVSYSHDALFYSRMATMVHEGWIYTNPRSGYPFGLELYDFPTSDSGSFFLAKLIGFWTDSPLATANIIYLLSFPLVFVAATCVFRWFDLKRTWAYCAAALFVFLPFHLLRFEHLNYTLYFTIPLYFYVAYSFAYSSAARDAQARTYVQRFGPLLLLAGLTCFGVYNAAFGTIMLVFSGLYRASQSRNFKSFFAVLPAVAAVLIGVFLNLLPNFIHWAQYGKSQVVAIRSPAESELYGLKFIQLILPVHNHWLRPFGWFRDYYDFIAPLANENSSSSLGLAGSVGLILLAVIILKRFSGRYVERKQMVVAFLLLVLIFFGIIGGGGAMFAFAISPLIRAWNRISVFIGFGAILLAFLVLQTQVARWSLFQRHVWLAPLTAVVLSILGVLDQTPKPCHSCLEANQTAAEMDHRFVTAISNLIPADAAIYQLPYMSFPESRPPYKMGTYVHFILIAHSPTLRASYGGIAGSAGDWFFRGMETLPFPQQMEAMRKLGFHGLWINRHGYPDHANAIIASAVAYFGHEPDLTREDGEIVFFIIPNVPEVDLKGKSSNQIMAVSGIIIDEYGLRYTAQLSEGIDFTRPDLPSFVSHIRGLSDAETWGRWTDGNIAPSLVLEFEHPLPQKLKLRLALIPFGPNENNPLTIRIGTQSFQRTLVPGKNVIEVETETSSPSADRIELIPYSPTTPVFLGMNGDRRKLGVGLIKMDFM